MISEKEMNQGEISEEEVAAHVIYVASAEDHGWRLSADVAKAVLAGADLSVEQASELHRWLIAVTDDHDWGSPDWELCVDAVRDGGAVVIREVALRVLTRRALWSARLHRDPAQVPYLETALVRGADGKLEVRKIVWS